MVDPVFVEKVKKLPIKQQIALWVILKHFNATSGARFTAADFGLKAGMIAGSTDARENARTLGGILSSLVRNGVVEQFTGGRQPVWQIVSELHENAHEYEKIFNPVVTYWEENEEKQ